MSAIHQQTTVIISKHFKLERHAFYELHDINFIGGSLTNAAASVAIHTFVTSHTDQAIWTSKINNQQTAEHA